jgi:hypothetical protein
MKFLSYIFSAICISLNASCVSTFQKASITRIDANRDEETINNHPLRHQYKIGGQQQMFIYLDPKKEIFQSQYPNFTQVELSKLKFKVVSLGGKLSVNGLKIDKGETLVVDLRKIYNVYGEGGVEDYGKYVSIIRFVSYKNVPADDNLCDFILTIEDPEGITRTTGLRVHGGFTDSL